MSRASKYLRKKKAEGGLLDPEALKNLAAANPPKPGTGVAGPKLEPQQSTAQNIQEALKSFRANNPQAQTSEPEMPTQIKGRTAEGFSGKLPTPRMSNPNIASQTPAPQQRPLAGGTTQSLMADFQARQNQPEMTDAQKAAMQQANAENQATMESPEYQEALQKFQDSKGQDSESRALLEKLSGEMTAIQRGAAPQPRFTKESLMGVQGQQIQGVAPQRMAASAVTGIIEQPNEPTRPTPPEGTRPTEPKREVYGVGSRGDSRYKLAMAEHSRKASTQAWKTYDDSEAQYAIDLDQFGKDSEEWETFQSTQSSDSSGTSTTSTDTGIVEEPTEPPARVPKPQTSPRSCDGKVGGAYETCMVARNQEKKPWNAYNASQNLWKQYDADLIAYNDASSNVNNGGDTNSNNNSNNNSNTNNTGGTGNVVDNSENTEGSVGTSSVTVVNKNALDAPTRIVQERPDVTAPVMAAETMSNATKKPTRSDYPEGEAGAAQWQGANNAWNNQIATQTSTPKPVRRDFDTNEQYMANLRQWQSTPLTAQGTVSTSNDLQSLDDSEAVTATGASATSVATAKEQMPRPQINQFTDTVDADGNVTKTKQEKHTQALKNWNDKISADAPTDITAKGFTATEAAVTTATAATDGTVTQTASADAPALTKAAEAADIDATAVEAAKGTEIERQAQTEVATAMSAYSQVKESAEYAEVNQRKAALLEKRKADPAWQAIIAEKEAAKASGDPERIKAASVASYEYNTEIRGLEIQRIGMLDAAGAKKVAEVEGPEAAIRVGQTIGEQELSDLMDIAEDRGVDLEDMEEYKLAKTRLAQEGTAAQGTAAQMQDIIAPAAAEGTAVDSDFTPQGGNTEIDGTPAFEVASQRTAQVAEAAERVAQELGDAPALDLEGREAITGTAPQGDASQIGGIPTVEAARMSAVTGQDRNVAAADMLAVVADVPADVAAALSEDPATVIAQIDSNADPKVTAAVAALPTEALVSTQMEGLLAGMEEGKTPAWARPALAAIEANLAKRGMSASSIGRDAMFNAIIQSALPIAQSNATALQDRARQNLSNEQQANLAAAQNTMTVRMQNLANRQTAASQTASMAQEIKVQQGSFSQQAVITEAQQDQQTKITNAQMAQDRAKQESAQKQQAAIATLDSNTQKDLANLRALNEAESQNMTAEQQTKLKRYEATVSKVMRQADLKQDMEKANLGPALQIELANLSEQNAAAKDTMTAEQTEKLTRFNALMDFRKTDATMAQQMDMANMSNEQQMELAMLSEKAATDSANFTAENQFELAELQSKVARSVRQGELNARMEEVNLDSSLKIELAELSERNTMSRANMSADQQTRLANLNTLVDFKKTNATMSQQMELANMSNEQQIEMAELADRSATDAANFTEANRFRLQELSQATSILSSNEELRARADMAKLSTSERVSLANLTAKNQADSESMSAENVAELQVFEKKMGAAQVNAQLAQQMGMTELSNAQQTAMFNAQVNSNLDIKKFDADQQTQLANSKFMQTMEINQFSGEQQAAMQNATSLATMDLATADQATKLAITNAQNFLQMDMANLSNEQQASVMNAQMSQQRLISNAAAQNAAAQFGAASENDTEKFMSNLSAQVDQYNTSAAAAREQFNATETNRRAAQEAGNQTEVDKLNAQMSTDISKFNEQQDLARDQWNAANAQAVEQSNVQWRRQSNTADTAAQNAANQQNAQMSFNLTSQELTQVWQQMRDEAAYLRQSYENDEQRKAQLLATAIGNEENFTTAGELNSLLNSTINKT